jgi:hypothetical protein
VIRLVTAVRACASSAGGSNAGERLQPVEETAVKGVELHLASSRVDVEKQNAVFVESCVERFQILERAHEQARPGHQQDAQRDLAHGEHFPHREHASSCAGQSRGVFLQSRRNVDARRFQRGHEPADDAGQE